MLILKEQNFEEENQICFSNYITDKKVPLNQLDTLVAFPMPSISLASRPNIVGEKSSIQLA
jgi:hypothetical protein